MVNYKQAIEKIHKMLVQLEWPKVVFIPAADYWVLIIASEGAITPDWHFDGKEEDEGFAFFVLGPTMVRANKRRANTAEMYLGFDRRKKKHPLVQRKVTDNFVKQLAENESISAKDKAQITKQVKDGDLRVEEFKS